MGKYKVIQSEGEKKTRQLKIVVYRKMWWYLKLIKELRILAKVTVRFYLIIMVTTKRSVDNFGLLIVGFYGEAVEKPPFLK